MTCFDGLLLKKSRSACGVLGQLGKISRLLWAKRSTSDPSRDFPLHELIFARLVPRAQVAFSSEPSRNLLCATILDIISTCCAYILSLRRARSPPRHAAWDRARAAAGPQHSDGARANGSLFAPPVDLISFTLYGAG